MKIKVANIIEEGRLGGPHVRIARVASALPCAATTVIIMPEEGSSSFQELCDSENLSYIVLPMHRMTKSVKELIKYIVFFPYEVFRLTALFKQNKFDIVHVSGGSWQYKGVLAGKLAGAKVLWHLNDTSSRSWVIRHAFKQLSCFSDGYIFASERSRSYYADYVASDKPDFVIPAPVDTEKFDPAISFLEDKELISQWEGKTVIGTVANINPVKDFETFIRAVNEVNSKADGMVFIIVGRVYESQQRYFDRLKELCSSLDINNLVFIDGRKDVRALLKRMDIYVCSSKAESSPVSVWEAMSMKKPIVSTDVGDVPLYIQDSKNGYIVGVGDHRQLSECLISLINNKTRQEAFGQESRRIAVQRLGLAQCAQAHLDAYKQVIDSVESSRPSRGE